MHCRLQSVIYAIGHTSPFLVCENLGYELFNWVVYTHYNIYGTVDVRQHALILTKQAVIK